MVMDNVEDMEFKRMLSNDDDEKVEDDSLLLDDLMGGSPRKSDLKRSNRSDSELKN